MLPFLAMDLYKPAQQHSNDFNFSVSKFSRYFSKTNSLVSESFEHKR